MLAVIYTLTRCPYKLCNWHKTAPAILPPSFLEANTHLGAGLDLK
jgi:hypothetical protein